MKNTGGILGGEANDTQVVDLLNGLDRTKIFYCPTYVEKRFILG